MEQTEPTPKCNYCIITDLQAECQVLTRVLTRDSHLLMAGESTQKTVSVPILFGTRIAV